MPRGGVRMTCGLHPTENRGQRKRTKVQPNSSTALFRVPCTLFWLGTEKTSLQHTNFTRLVPLFFVLVNGVDKMFVRFYNAARLLKQASKDKTMGKWITPRLLLILFAAA